MLMMTWVALFETEWARSETAKKDDNVGNIVGVTEPSEEKTEII